MTDANTPRGLVCAETSSRMVGAVDDPEPVLLLDTAGDGVCTRVRLREAAEAES